MGMFAAGHRGLIPVWPSWMVIEMAGLAFPLNPPGICLA